MTNRWATGRLVAPTDWSEALIGALDQVDRWVDGPADAVVDASALAGEPVTIGDAPRRTIHIAPDGRRDPLLAARTGALIGSMRARALADAPSGATANLVLVPAGFPATRTPQGAPIAVPVDLADLVHTVGFLLHPDNGYVTGQVIGLLGGDDVWGF